MAGYIASTIPAKIVRVSGVTLFQVAMMETGDPLQWVAIAHLNGITDPWIVGQEEILIPPVLPSGPQTGILDMAVSPAIIITPVTPGMTIAPPPPPSSAPSLDFSQSGNSQYLPLT